MVSEIIVMNTVEKQANKAGTVDFLYRDMNFVYIKKLLNYY